MLFAMRARIFFVLFVVVVTQLTAASPVSAPCNGSSEVEATDENGRCKKLEATVPIHENSG